MNTEKITLNISAIDLANIDLLVENGFAINRSEFMKTAIKQYLSNLEDETKLLIKNEESQAKKNRLGWVFGGYYLTKDAVQKYIANQENVRLIVYGFLMVEEGITTDQLSKCITSVKVFGVIKADKQIKEYLKNHA